MFFANEKCIVFRTAFNVPSPYSAADGARIHLNAILLKQTIWYVLQYAMSVVVKDLMSTNSLCIIKELERTKAKIYRIYASSTKIKISIKNMLSFTKKQSWWKKLVPYTAGFLVILKAELAAAILVDPYPSW